VAVSNNGTRFVNYARRQQYRRLSHAAGSAIGSGTSALIALALVGAGAISLAAILVVMAVGFGLCARHWFGLAERSRVGARSEDEVRHKLAALEKQCWRVRHSLRWRGRGDIDSVVIAPSGAAFAIETKTRTYDHRHLAGVREQAAWLGRRQRRRCRQGSVPVLCIVRARGVQRWERDVLVVSIDRLVPALRHTSEALTAPLRGQPTRPPARRAA
jgi:hypothetical protein